MLQKNCLHRKAPKTDECDKTFKNNVEEELRNLKQNHPNTQEDDFLNRNRSGNTKAKNGKAAGPDQIYTYLIKKSNDTLLKVNKILFEAYFATGQLPQLWTTAKVKFLHKPGKDNYYLPGSYRPIGLTSKLGQCMERIINSRLYALTEHHELIDKEQEGFREKRGTTHALLKLAEDVFE